MNNKMKLKLLRILPVLILIADMAFIFYNSAQEAQASSAASGAVTERIAALFVPHYRDLDEAEQLRITSQLNSVVREAAHMLQFVPLGASLYWLLYTFELKKTTKRFLLPITVGCGFIYAISDEIHQIFVPGRAFQWLDIGMDTCGALLGAVASAVLIVLIKLCIARRERGRDNGSSNGSTTSPS